MEMERDWAGLPLDVLASIFAKLRADDLSLAGLVCHLWLEAAKLPDLWRSIDMAHITYANYFKFSYEYYSTMAKVAVDRADGRLEAFAGRFFIRDELLRYIAERSPSLKSLTIISSSGVTDEALGAILDGCPRLEVLHVSDCFNVTFCGSLDAKFDRIKTVELTLHHERFLYPDTFDDDDDDDDGY